MAFFNKVRGNIIGVKFSKKEQEAIDREIHRQLLYAHRQSEIDDDCSLLWMLHEQFGFGYDRLKKRGNCCTKLIKNGKNIMS